MATTTRSPTPRTEPFSPIETAPYTPRTLPSIPNLTTSPRRDSLHPPSFRAALPVNTVSRTSLSPKAYGHTLSPRLSPLTGAAAMAEARRRKQQTPTLREDSRQMSPNPQATALSALMGSTGMSKARDAPSPSRVSEPMQRVSEKIILPSITETITENQSRSTVPQYGSASSYGGPGAMTATTTDESSAPQFVDEPDTMTPNHSNHGDDTQLSPEDENSNRPFTYPGPLHTRDQPAPSRGMSLPGAGHDQSPKTATKRHKCPYCSTDFTRHHNLKSHLLTHSQEKPYVCQNCQARFRRLHDLKRHTKLHTGERPHTCPKCGRRFARGDALARHNKGPGGCAGRRSSIGGDDDGEGGEGDETMDGLEYQDEQGGDDRDEDELEDSLRRGSEPSRKRVHHETLRDAERAVYRQHSSTYPPPMNRVLRQEAGVMGPPQTLLPSSATASPDLTGNALSMGSSYSSQYYPPPPGSVLQHGSITSSPKPLSPGQQNPHRLSVGDASIMRNRSPSLTQQFQHDQFGRGGGRSLTTQGHVPSYPPPILPSLGSIAPSHPPPNRMSIQQGPPTAGPSMLHHQQHAPQASMSGSNPSSNSISSHGQSSGGSMRDIIGHDQHDLWGYVRTLEQRFSRMQDEYELRISRLQEDVISLKGQLHRSR